MLTSEMWSVFIVFAIVTIVTPGPNNAMVVTSGMNFGVHRTIPHILGISLGFPLMIIVVGMGLNTVFSAYPVLYQIVRYLGAIYLLYLAWNIARLRSISDNKAESNKPLSFLSAAVFQWVNPKGWMMAITAVSTYAARDHYFANVFIIAFVFGLLLIPNCSLWAIFGNSLRRWLTNPQRLRLFNITMAALLVASLYPLIKTS